MSDTFRAAAQIAADNTSGVAYRPGYAVMLALGFPSACEGFAQLCMTLDYAGANVSHKRITNDECALFLDLMAEYAESDIEADAQPYIELHSFSDIVTQ